MKCIRALCSVGLSFFYEVASRSRISLLNPNGYYITGQGGMLAQQAFWYSSIIYYIPGIYTRLYSFLLCRPKGICSRAFHTSERQIDTYFQQRGYLRE